MAKETVEKEALAVSDNPILQDRELGVLHGVVFANGIAWAADQLNDAIARTAEIDRQILC